MVIVRQVGAIGLALVLLWAETALGSLDEQWAEFKTKFGKSYLNAREEEYRLQVFKDNMERAAGFASIDHTATYGVSSLSDRTDDELFRRMPSLQAPPATRSRPDAKRSDLPASWSWTTVPGALNPVRDQGNSCGSCWAFASISAMELGYFAATGKSVALSEGQLVDCTNPGKGCLGLDPLEALKYVIRVGGVMKRADYPYTEASGTCKADSSRFTVNVGSVWNYSPESSLKGAIFDYGSAVVCLDASKFVSYQGGIMSEDGCRAGAPNHCVTAVGWGVESSSGTPYWILRDSYGASVRENGYVRIKSGVNACGLADFPRVLKGVYSVRDDVVQSSTSTTTSSSSVDKTESSSASDASTQDHPPAAPSTPPNDSSSLLPLSFCCLLFSVSVFSLNF